MLSKRFIELLILSKPGVLGTSLITLYIPPNTDLWLYTSKIQKEYATAKNIKSKQVRDAVKRALKTTEHLLKDAPKSETGYVVCSGEIQEYV